MKLLEDYYKMLNIYDKVKKTYPDNYLDDEYTLKILKNKNLGDGLVYYNFISILCSNKYLKYADMKTHHNTTNYMVIGSVLRYCDKNSIICGAGFISEDEDLGSMKSISHNNAF